MFLKHKLQLIFATALISFPLSATVNQNSALSINFDFIQTELQIESTDTVNKIPAAKKQKKTKEDKKTKRQRELMEKREKALAEIEARKANAEQEAQAELSEQAESSEQENTEETQIPEEQTKLEETPQTTESQDSVETPAVSQEQLEKQAAIAAAEAEKAAALAREEQQKKEKEMLQKQIEKELENQKTQAEKNKKEYLSDYMVYDIETINDSDESEEAFNRIPNPDERDASGKTLLMRAAKEGNEWELKQLLDSKADVNLTDSDGWTALMYAVRYSGNMECVEKLLEAGANVSAKNNYGFSALVLAACYNGNPKILTKLLEDYKASDKEVLRALVFLLSEQNISERQQISKLQIFMDKAVPLNILYEGKTPLMYAAKYGNSTKVIQILLDNQSSVTLRSTEGKTAFDYAIINNNLAHDETYWALNKK